ncbi:MAG TPA: hypothetical protein VHV81_01165 [Steroidobacteraceae bacterium]|jgi:hypothetical protein|nr:hypothetical protein [Steroidobacteraceae bacterium]
MGSDEVHMPEFRPTADAPFRTAPSCPGVRDTLLLALVLIALSAAEARAEEHPRSNDLSSDAGAVARPPSAVPAAPPADELGAALRPGGLWATAPFGKSTDRVHIGDMFSAPADGGLPRYSAADFSPRRRNMLDPDPGADLETDSPMLRGTTLWQRMADFRSHDRVRVLTLWESSGGAVSLQAGRRGDPSLQWTSTNMNRGGATRGLLDKLFSVSIAGAGQTLRSVTRSRGAAPASRGNPAAMPLK